MNEAKAVTPKFNDVLFDQFKLSEEFGGNFINSARAMKILRLLREQSPSGEGKLCNKVGSRTFLPEWQFLLTKLESFNFITVEPTGHGIARSVTLTAVGEQFLEYKLGAREVVEQPTEQQQGQKEA
jgi:hypothetical protein